MSSVEIVPINSRYIPLTQQKWCCVPTCLQIIMLRRGIKLISAEELGYEMGLIVPPREKSLFWNVRTGSRPKAGYGTQIQKPEFALNFIFTKLSIPLKVDYFLDFPTVESFRSFLAAVDYSQDYLFCFDWGTLHNTDYRTGHACLLDTVIFGKEELRIIDTLPDAPKWQTVSFKQMYQAIKNHAPVNYGGIWKISSRT